MIVGGPLERIGSPSRSSSVPSAGHEARGLLDAGRPTGRARACPSASSAGPRSPPRRPAAPGRRRRCPCWVRSKRSLNDASIVSVKTNVPATNATPMTTAKPVSAVRSLRASRPLSATLSTSHGLHQVEHALGALAAAVVHDPAVAEHDDAVGHRGGVRVVRDHHDGLAELVDGLAQQRRAPRRTSASPGCRSARRRTPPPGGGSARARRRRAAAGRRTARTGGASSRSPRPDGGDQLVVPLAVGLAAGQRERQQDVLLGGQDRHEVEGLEDEAEPVAAQARERLVVEVGELGAVDHHRARRSAGRAPRAGASAWTCPSRTGP